MTKYTTHQKEKFVKYHGDINGITQNDIRIYSLCHLNESMQNLMHFPVIYSLEDVFIIRVSGTRTRYLLAYYTRRRGAMCWCYVYFFFSSFLCLFFLRGERARPIILNG